MPTIEAQLVSEDSRAPSVQLAGIAKRLEYSRATFTPGSYPKNLFLLPVLLLLNHLVGAVELVCAVLVGSLGLCAHGSHMIFNSVILTGLVASCLITWRERKRYSLECRDVIARANFIVGIGFLANTGVIAYLSARDVIQPPEIRYESLFYLIPVPALLLDLVSIYVIVHGNGEDEDDVLGEMLRPKARCESRDNVTRHILANALGSIATIVSTVLVQVLGWTLADTLCAVFVAFIMAVCALNLIKESIDSTIATRKQASVFTVDYCMKNEVYQLSNVFTV